MFEHGAAIGLNAHLQFAVEPQLLCVNIDLDDLGLGGKQRAELQAVVDSFAEDDDEVGLGKSLPRPGVDDRVRIAEAQRMLVRNETARERDGEQWDLRLLDEGLELLARLRPPAARTRDDDWTLG